MPDQPWWRCAKAPKSRSVSKIAWVGKWCGNGTTDWTAIIVNNHVVSDRWRGKLDFLSDRLLVHGFGFSKIEMSPPRYIDLCINKPASVQLQACKKDGERVLKLNSISLACQTIEAFDRLKKKVEEGDTDLCATILEALEYTHPVSERVLHQFDKVYEEAQRKGAACPA